MVSIDPCSIVEETFEDFIVELAILFTCIVHSKEVSDSFPSVAFTVIKYEPTSYGSKVKIVYTL